MSLGITKTTTTLLAALSDGDNEAARKLFSIVYRELHTLAHAAMRRERQGHILQTTALVHEAYLRLVPGEGLRCEDRAHFFGLAARAMRHILINEARKRNAVKRGSGRQPLSLDDLHESKQEEAASSLSFEDLEALETAMKKLEQYESLEWVGTLVDLRFFVGLTFDEIAEIMSFSKGTLMRRWDFAKAWLQRELEG